MVGHADASPGVVHTKEELVVVVDGAAMLLEGCDVVVGEGVTVMVTVAGDGCQIIAFLRKDEAATHAQVLRSLWNIYVQDLLGGNVLVLVIEVVMVGVCVTTTVDAEGVTYIVIV